MHSEKRADFSQRFLGVVISFTIANAIVWNMAIRVTAVDETSHAYIDTSATDAHVLHSISSILKCSFFFII